MVFSHQIWCSKWIEVSWSVWLLNFFVFPPPPQEGRTYVGREDASTEQDISEFVIWTCSLSTASRNDFKAYSAAYTSVRKQQGKPFNSLEKQKI